ncbi:hypothetical protein IQ238_05880 [Pleurocapsales cyanobacterium LEGE 06147]|nr:hypothetical protein [Pleurocapsales cyanobacterium LEGE 06147]
MRPMMVDWEHHAKNILAAFRATRAQHIGDRWFEELIETLKEACPEFNDWWKQHDVQNYIQ